MATPIDSPLRLVDDSIVFANAGDNTNITVVDGTHKRCLAFGMIVGGLYALLRESTAEAAADDDRSVSKRLRRGADKKGGKTAAGTPVSSDAKRTLSIFTFDATTADIHFKTHVSVAGWSSLVVAANSPFVILSDYNTAHSEVLEWLPSSKTLRRVWEGKGCCPHHFHDGEHILLLLYSARKLILCDGRTMKEICDCNARSRELDILDVFATNNRAIVVYDNGACSVFSVAEDSIKRIGDLGKVLGGKIPTDLAVVDEVEALLLYTDDHDEEICVLNPTTSGNKETYEKGSADREMFEDTITEAAKLKAIKGGTAAKKGASKKGKKEKGAASKSADTDADSKKRGARGDGAKSSSEGGDARKTGGAEEEEGGVSLFALVGIAAISMAITAAVVMKVVSNSK